MTFNEFVQQYLLPAAVTLLSVVVPLLVVWFKTKTAQLEKVDAKQQTAIDINSGVAVDLHDTATTNAAASARALNTGITVASVAPAPLPPSLK